MAPFIVNFEQILHLVAIVALIEKPVNLQLY